SADCCPRQVAGSAPAERGPTRNVPPTSTPAHAPTGSAITTFFPSRLLLPRVLCAQRVSGAY
ncbi:MAG: hypothetical protein M3Y48_23075, partial [Actinomycetota bacterium]|nr:hypothetical protein [Actinomycetota bacterium]